MHFEAATSVINAIPSVSSLPLPPASVFVPCGLSAGVVVSNPATRCANFHTRVLPKAFNLYFGYFGFLVGVLVMAVLMAEVRGSILPDPYCIGGLSLFA